jgi:hypothetical protein
MVVITPLIKGSVLSIYALVLRYFIEEYCKLRALWFAGDNLSIVE